MSFSIEWKPKPFNFLESLQKGVALRILEKLDRVKEDPFRYLEHYEGDYYKLRIGDYRMLIDIDFDQKVLIIQVFDKRGRIYKR